MQIKEFKSCNEQVSLLKSRCLIIGDHDEAVRIAPDVLSKTDLLPEYNQNRHKEWLKKYRQAQLNSHGDFVKHDNKKYERLPPIWVAIEIMDWGMLSHLYSMSPREVRDSIAQHVELSAPQRASWLKSLNILRNYSAHHARLFNRVFRVKPVACCQGVFTNSSINAGISCKFSKASFAQPGKTSRVIAE